MPAEIDPDERLMEGWEPSPVPIRGPDDPLPAPPRVHLPQVVAPTLCELGPCSHYHHAVIRFDAATPMDGSDDVTHTQTIRTCIPGAGVTLELEDKPVFECSFWDPNVELQTELERRREEIGATRAGELYLERVAAWRADQARIRKEIEEELANPQPELSVLDAMIAELKPGDVLELRPKGKSDRLAWWAQSVIAEMGVTEAWIREAYGPNTYQLRRVNAAGAIVSTRLYTIDPLTPTEPKETPNP